MPSSPARPCSYPGCQTLVKAGRCDVHQVTTGWERDVKRQRLYGRRWQAFRRKFLAENPWCVECQRAGVSAPATDVDHLIDHKGDPVKFWAGPFQALCKSHHSQKTAQELGAGGSQNFGAGRCRAQWEVRTKNNPNVGNSKLNGKPLKNDEVKDA